MSSCNPYSQLNLTYDRKTDSAHCIEMRQQSDVALTQAEANLRQCIERLQSCNGDIHLLDQAVEAYTIARRDHRAAISSSENTAVRLEEIKAAMSTWSYKQASLHIQNEKERLAKAERDALEKSHEFTRIMSALDPRVRAVVGNSYYPEDTLESESFAPGQLVACHCDAFSNGRSNAETRFIAAIVISAEDEDSYRVAFNCYVDFSDLKVIRRCHLRALVLAKLQM